MDFGPVTETHKLTYQANVELAVQEKTSPFEAGFTFHADLKGRQVQLVDLVGSTEAIVDGPRGGDTPNVGGSHEQVWARPRSIEWGKVIEKEDAIKALTDFQSPYVQSGALAVRRAKNAIFAAALFGDRITGQDGAATDAYVATGRTVGIQVGSANGATDTGMNVKKILRAFRYLEDFEVNVEEEELFLALDPEEIEGLYNDVTYVNKDYRDRAVLEDKRVLSILGVTIVPTKRVADVGSDSIAALWCKSGMHWGEFDPVRTMVMPNPAKKYRPHPYIETWVGATRGEDAKVVKIVNKKA